MASAIFKSMVIDPIEINNEVKMTFDLRSDTVTLPSKEMRQCALDAPVGDDVFGEDPSANALQAEVAKLLGKEAALFVPSGTMANLICVMTHCWERGTEVLLGDESHIFIFEQGGIAQIGGVLPRPLRNKEDGTFSIEEMKMKIREESIHFPKTTLVCIENTHCKLGGRALPMKWLKELYEACDELKIPVHVDGARLLNASVARDVSPITLVGKASSVSICMSKGLGAPIGSVIAGSKDFIERATRVRKVLGGAMRQCGIVAAMGSLALKDYVTQFRKDHKNTQTIAKDMRSPIIHVDLESVDTNIIYLEHVSPKITSNFFCFRLANCKTQELRALRGEYLCKLQPMSPTVTRLVVHRNISEEDVELIIKKIIYVIKEYEMEFAEDDDDDEVDDEEEEDTSDDFLTDEEEAQDDRIDKGDDESDD